MESLTHLQVDPTLIGIMTFNKKGNECIHLKKFDGGEEKWYKCILKMLSSSEHKDSSNLCKEHEVLQQ